MVYIWSKIKGWTIFQVIYLSVIVKNKTTLSKSLIKIWIFRENLTFWPLFDLYLTFNDRLILLFFTIIFQIKDKIITWYVGASSAPLRLVELKNQSFWFSNLYHFRHFLGSLGGPGTLNCTLNLKSRFKISINEMSKMFNSSTRKHSLRKSGNMKEIHPFKKTEKFIKGN